MTVALLLALRLCAGSATAHHAPFATPRASTPAVQRLSPTPTITFPGPRPAGTGQRSAADHVTVPEWLAGAIVAAVATILLIIPWDLYKERRQRTERRHAQLHATLAEVKVNRAILISNEERLKSDLTYISNSAIELNPLQLLHRDLLPALLTDLPAELIQRGVDIDRLAQLVFSIDDMNLTIHSREMHRIQNQGQQLYLKHLEEYDHTTIEAGAELLKGLDGLQQDLEASLITISLWDRAIGRTSSGAAPAVW